MASFVKGPDYRTPFGGNNFLRSTQDVKTESFTVAASTVPAVTIDNHPGQKVLQKGTVMAKITSGPEAGKVGPYNADAEDGRGGAGNIVGLNQTFLPWQLMERDVEIAIVVECRAVQDWCLEYEDDDTIVPLTDATADAMVAKKSLSIIFA